MTRRPGYTIGDTIEFKAGKRGYHYGLKNGSRYVVVGIEPPRSVPNPRFRKGEWGGYVVSVAETNMAFPCAWFRKVTL